MNAGSGAPSGQEFNVFVSGPDARSKKCSDAPNRPVGIALVNGHANNQWTFPAALRTSHRHAVVPGSSAGRGQAEAHATGADALSLGARSCS
jgi:hypothetical protein